jgi:L-arabinose isomerase
MTGRPRVGMLVPFWEFWEKSARGDLRAHLRQVAEAAAAALREVDVVASAVLFIPEEAEQVAEQLRASGAEALLVVQVMAVPPARTTRVLDALGDLPLVVWGLHLERRAGEAYDHSDIATEGATVGTSQLVSMLVRRERPFALQVGRLSDPGTVAAVEGALRAAWASRRIASGRLARVGSEPPGYDCVVCDPGELTAAIGLQVIDLAPAELARAYEQTGAVETERVRAETESSFVLADGLTAADEGLRRSLRFAAALERFDGEHGIDAGAINCHLPELRFSPEVGIAPCFALGRETTRGVPWACAGDMLTAVALLTTKLLGAAALYHELETIDYDADELVIANTGEHDLAWADPRVKPQLRANGWFASDPVCGACACMSPPAGPATLVSFVPHPAEPSGFRYIVAEGEFTPRSYPEAGTPNAAFRFRERSAVDGFTAWSLAGANHHSSSTPGHLGDQVARVAAYLRVGLVRVS